MQVSSAQFNKPFEWFNLLCRTADIGSGFKDLNDTYRSENLSTVKKTLLVVYDTIFVSSAAADCAVRWTSSSSKMKMTSKAMIAISDISRQYLRRGLGEHTMKVAYVRVRDIATAVIMDKAFSEQGSTATKMVQILAVGIHIWNNKTALNSCANKIYNFCHKMFGFSQESLVPALPLPPREVPEEPQDERPRSLTSREEEIYAQAALYRRRIDWRSLEEIPVIDEVLQQYICTMTQQPIRHVLVLRFPLPQPLYFERAAVSNWLDHRRGEVPNHWPEDLPLPIRTEYFEAAADIQTIIDDRLQFLAENAFWELEALKAENPDLFPE